MKKLSGMLLVLLFLLCGCSLGKVDVETESIDEELNINEVVNDDESNVNMDDSMWGPDENMIISLVEKLYTVEDIETYQKDLDKIVSESLEGRSYTFGYDAMCVDDGLTMVLYNHKMLRDVALNQAFRMSVHNIELIESFVKEADGSVLNQYDKVGYEYTADVLLEYEDGTTEILHEGGAINVKHVEDQWKIYGFSLTDSMGFWRELYQAR